MAPASLQKKKESIELKGRVREFIFGIQDGLISMVGLLSGVQSAGSDERVVLLSGFAAMFTGALSMATGAYLSSKAEEEIFKKELREQEKFVEEEPSLSREGLLEALVGEGLSRETAYRAVKLFSEQKSVFLRTFQEKVLGLGSAELQKPLQAALVMYLSFVAGAAVPLLPYLLLELSSAFYVSVALTGGTLFLVGIFKGFLARKPLLLAGLEFLAVALGSALVGWLVGILFSRLS